MKNRLKRAADIFFTVVLAASLSGCASILDYWSTEETAEDAAASVTQTVSDEEADTDTDRIPEDPLHPEGQPDDSAENQPESLEEKAVSANSLPPPTGTPIGASSGTPIGASSGANPAAGSNSVPAGSAAALADAQKRAAEAEAARKKAEDELAAANERIAALLAAQPAPETATAALADAQKQTAEAEAARKKAEADAAAAKKKADTDLAAAQKKAADAETARKKAEADAAAAKKKADTDLAAAQKKAADAEIARQKAETDAAELRKNIEEISLSRPAAITPAEQPPQISLAGQQTPSMTNASPAIPNAAQNAAVQDTSGIVTEPPTPAEEAVLPKYYIVGAWPPDCFWDIAEIVYHDPYRWPILYEANRSKLEDPDNPDLLEVGTILEIPAINGERREGYFAQ
jgi:hypothetical protein